MGVLHQRLKFSLEMPPKGKAKAVDADDDNGGGSKKGGSGAKVKVRYATRIPMAMMV